MAEKPHYGPEEPDVLALSWALEWVRKQMKAMERASKARSAEQKNEWAVRANERVDPVLASGFLVVLDHSEP